LSEMSVFVINRVRYLSIDYLLQARYGEKLLLISTPPAPVGGDLTPPQARPLLTKERAPELVILSGYEYFQFPLLHFMERGLGGEGEQAARGRG